MKTAPSPFVTATWLPFLAAALAFLVAAPFSNAATLSTFSFTGATAGSTGPFAPESPDPGVSVSNLTGSNLGTRGVNSAFLAATDASVPAYTFDGRGYEIFAGEMTNQAVGPVGSTYNFSFTLTPTAGNQVLYTGLSIDFGTDFNAATGGTLALYDLFYSVNGGPLTQAGATSSRGGTDNTHTVSNDVLKDLSAVAAFSSPIDTPVTFQLRFADTNSGLNTKAVFIDDIRVIGTVSTPEPGSALLVLSGAALLIRRRRNVR